MVMFENLFVFLKNRNSKICLYFAKHVRNFKTIEYTDFKIIYYFQGNV